MKEISTKAYYLEIPEEWEMHSSEDSAVSIYKPDGKGSITLSSYSYDVGVPDVESELKKFARKDILVNKKKNANQESAWAQYENLSEDGDIFFTYSIAVGGRGSLLLASYHCKKNDLLPQELNIVKQIFESILLKAI